MKNLLFALLLWESKIYNCRTVEIHTDNPALLIHQTLYYNEYGRRVQAFMQHFRQCRGIQVKYRVTNLRRDSNYENFARFIQPADDLSRDEIDRATNYLNGIYSISKFSGAYSIGHILFNQAYQVSNPRIFLFERKAN